MRSADVDHLPLLSIDDSQPRRISPTDISQFIRLEQCQRYLRLRLYERAAGASFLGDYGVTPQSIAPLLTRSGATFEQAVQQAVAGHLPLRDFAAGRPNAPLANDNAEVLRMARDLAAGTVVVLFQPRLHVTLNGWRLSGDIDILRLERDAAGALHLLVADMKSSTSARVEHRLQVAFYLEMLDALLQEAAVAYASLKMGILYRGPADPSPALTDAERAADQRRSEAAARALGVTHALLEIVPDPESYRGSVHDLVTGDHSTARQVAVADFDDLFFHLSYKCDGCLYTEFCMKWSAEQDDLSLLPHLTAEEKSALRRNGVRTMHQLATLKDFRAGDGDGKPPSGDLVVAPGNDALVNRLGTTWPVGARLDELVHRARRYRRFKGDQLSALSYIPSKGYGSLPYTGPDHNPNLVRVYLDAQHDYLNDRIYLLGALVAGCDQGEESPARRRSIVELTDGPPETLEAERALFVRFTRAVIEAVAEVAAPDESGGRTAPIHLIFSNRYEQQLLLDGLARHLTSVFAATPLYDFVTQLAGFDSPVATFLDQEIRELKNYPMVCQSLQAVASFLKFDWNTPEPYRDVFRTRLFDYWSKFDGEPGGRQESRWYTSRARFNSQIPLEFAYAAWGELAHPAPGRPDEFAGYRAATPALLRGFQARRLEALAWVVQDFSGNRQTTKRPFALPDLASFQGNAQTLAQALDEFVTIERHSALAAWKTARLAPPERRVLAGDSLVVVYQEADQDVAAAERNREHQRRDGLAADYRQQAAGGALTKEQRAQTKWSAEGLRLRLRVECDGVDCGVEEALALTSFRTGDRLVVMPRTTIDTRPGADVTPFTPTPKQLLYGTRAAITDIELQRDAGGAVTAALIEIELREAFAPRDARGFVFGAISRPLRDGERLTLDPDPNDWYGYYGMKVVEGLCAGRPNALYERLAAGPSAPVAWPAEASAGQRRFLDGLLALNQVGALHPFEIGKQDYIGGHGDAPLLLVQGPPGTGKSYSTAFALFARLQGAIAAGRDFRAFVTCKTHAATDVLLQNVAAVQQALRTLYEQQPAICAQYFDRRLLDVPLYRLHGNPPAAGITALPRKSERPAGAAVAAETIRAARWCVVGTTPGGAYRMLKEKWNELFGRQFCDCLVLDEASQMNLPEAIMAALALNSDGQVIVVGDHRQMPPIVKHDWGGERRRTFQQFRTYESLFLTLLPLGLPLIQFAESFRLHADMAEFLRREVYAQDGIAYFSRRGQQLPAAVHADPFVAAVLRPEQTIVVVVHDEQDSMMRNAFEQTLISAILEALAAAPYDLDAIDGLGVVVPHRAQRAALQQATPSLIVVDPLTGRTLRSAVDTVERFQGDERSAIVVGATESDPRYLLASSEFLLDPRRLTVALSRAKHKLILVAARSVFALFSADEQTFANSQLWKNLLRRTCTTLLWRGERDGHLVEVWGNAPNTQ